MRLASQKVGRSASPTRAQTVVGQRLGRDHQTAYRQHASAQPGQSFAIALGGLDDMARDELGAVRGDDLMRRDIAHPTVLVDRDPAAFHRPRQPPHQFHRMHGRRMTKEQRAVAIAKRGAFGQRRAIEPEAVVGGMAQLDQRGAMRFLNRDLFGISCGGVQRTALVELCIDRFALGDAPDLVDVVGQLGTDRSTRGQCPDRRSDVPARRGCRSPNRRCAPRRRGRRFRPPAPRSRARAACSAR